MNRPDHKYLELLETTWSRLTRGDLELINPRDTHQLSQLIATLYGISEEDAEHQILNLAGDPATSGLMVDAGSV